MTQLWDPASTGPERTGYRTLNEVVDGFAGLEQRLRARHDRRSMFLTLYGVVSAEMRERAASGAFADPAWVQRYAVAFANLYRSALEEYDADPDGAELYPFSEPGACRLELDRRASATR